ncbi:uncharacterized protein KY384_001882 [Bacidia gigantensis]|uniref:uncharacterized protein n=1 Tax=Bacidia gigantensis TaxID=2732470 RepID=UPI001D050277|nr:uncharacterized protein KY384_001882 [Bacidia gigantensis]KAG8533099.1 hypothetical protein KY384_001882 [Bacidia gigantensis]
MDSAPTHSTDIQDNSDTLGPSSSPNARSDASSESRAESRRQIQAACCAVFLALLSNFSYYAAELPLLALVERRVCDHHYRILLDKRLAITQPLDGRSCMIPEVQNKVAFVVGSKTALDAIPPLLTSFWYGSIANRIGRRPVVLLACSGELLNLLATISIGFTQISDNIEWIWLASVFLAIGGGQFLLYAILDVIVIDVTQESKRVQWLSLLHATTLLNELCAAPLAAILMQQSLMTAFWVVICAALVRYPVIWMLPETVQEEQAVQETSGLENDTQIANISKDRQPLLVKPNIVKENQPTTLGLIKLLVSYQGIVFCYACFLVKRIAFTSEFLMFQRTSELLRQPLDKTAWIRIPLGASATFVTLICIPMYFETFGETRLRSDALKYEMRALRVSLSILTTGFGIYWLASNRTWMALGLLFCGAGEGLAPSLQALASNIVPSYIHTNLFAIISLVDTSAKLFGGPIMAAAYSIRDEAGQSYGLCFALSMTITE